MDIDIIHKAVMILKENLTEEELIELSDRLDGDPGHPMLDLLDEHLAKVRPDFFFKFIQVTKMEEDY